MLHVEQLGDTGEVVDAVLAPKPTQNTTENTTELAKTPCKQQVVGSNPTGGSIAINAIVVVASVQPLSLEDRNPAQLGSKGISERSIPSHERRHHDHLPQLRHRDGPGQPSARSVRRMRLDRGVHSVLDGNPRSGPQQSGRHQDGRSCAGVGALTPPITKSPAHSGKRLCPQAQPPQPSITAKPWSRVGGGGHYQVDVDRIRRAGWPKGGVGQARLHDNDVQPVLCENQAARVGRPQIQLPVVRS